MSLSTAQARSRLKTCTTMGSPAISRSTLRGSRVEERRAGMTPRIFTPLPYQNSRRSSPLPPARQPFRNLGRDALQNDAETAIYGTFVGPPISPSLLLQGLQ